MPQLELKDVLEHPFVQTLQEQLDTAANQSVQLSEDTMGVKLPYVLKDRVLMSPGTWRGKMGGTQIYNKDATKRIFDNTDWASRKVRSIFIEHKDDEIKNGLDYWVGLVQNPRFEESVGNIRGDLILYDLNTAIKCQAIMQLSEGESPERNIFGVSPRILTLGNPRPEGVNVLGGKLENFSLVVNPGIKRAFINNSDGTASELETLTQINDVQLADKKESKMMPGMMPEMGKEKEMMPKLVHDEEEMADMDAAARNALPDSAFAFVQTLPDGTKVRKLPIHDAAHVRNALARFTQTQGIPEDMKETVKNRILAKAKELGIESSAEMGGKTEKMDKMEVHMSETPQQTPVQLSQEELTSLVTNQDFPAFAKAHSGLGLNEMAEKFKIEKQAKSYAYSEEMTKLNEIVTKLAGKVDELSTKLNEPAPKRSETASAPQVPELNENTAIEQIEMHIADKLCAGLNMVGEVR